MIDTKQPTQSFKAVIAYNKNNESKYQSYVFTDILRFENSELLASQSASSSNGDLQLVLNNSGIYNIYGLDGSCSDKSQLGPYSITAELTGDKKWDQVEKITWEFPDERISMLIQATAATDSQVNEASQVVFYRLKDKYQSGVNNNTVKCIVKFKGVEKTIDATISFQFGYNSTSGSNYALNIDFADRSKNHLIPGGEPVKIQATFTKRDGTVLETPTIYWSWVFSPKHELVRREPVQVIKTDENGNALRNEDGSYQTEVKKDEYEQTVYKDIYNYYFYKADNIEDGVEIVQSIYNEDTKVYEYPRYTNALEENDIIGDSIYINYYGSSIPNENYAILKAEIKNYPLDNGLSSNLTAYLPIPIGKSGIENISGDQIVVYESLGNNASMTGNTYELLPAAADNSSVWEIEYDENQLKNTAHFKEPSLKAVGNFKYYNEEGQELSVSQFLYNEYSLEIPQYAPTSIPKVCIRGGYRNAYSEIGNTNKYTETMSEVQWISPILILQDTWDKELLNDWDGSFRIDEEEGIIMSSLLVAGKKEGNYNEFTGVLVGDVAKAGGVERHTGVYGYKEGTNRFRLTDDGEFFVGTNNGSRIYFDDNGELQIVGQIVDIDSNKFFLNSDTIKINSDDEKDNGEKVVKGIEIYGGQLTVYTNDNDNDKKRFWVSEDTIHLSGPSSGNGKYSANLNMSTSLISAPGVDGKVFLPACYLNGTWGIHKLEIWNNINSENINKEEEYLKLGEIGISPAGDSNQLFIGNGTYVNIDNQLVTDSNGGTLKNYWKTNSNFDIDGNSIIGGTLTVNNQTHFKRQIDIYDSNDFAQGHLNVNIVKALNGQKDYSVFNIFQTDTDGIEPGHLHLSVPAHGTIQMRIAQSPTTDHIPFQITTYKIDGTTYGDLYGDWYYNETLIETDAISDIKLKHDINLIEPKYETFFNSLIPVSYKYIKNKEKNIGTSQRTHLGFIANEIEQQLIQSGLTNQEFAGLKILNYTYPEREALYSLDLREFIALNTWQIQKLKARVLELEQRLKGENGENETNE